MPRQFLKMQGAGNDYVYFDCRKEPFPSPEQNSIWLSDRRFGIGGDGIVLLLPSTVADVRMRMFNKDGSEGRMCGNAVRCIGKILSKEEKKSVYTVETLSGIKKVFPEPDGTFTVQMGQYSIDPKDVPVLSDTPVVNKKIGGHFVTCVSMGNPHAVVFDDIEKLESLSREVRDSRLFPAGINVEVVSFQGLEATMRVDERGSGETLSCGTGACAVHVASVLLCREIRDWLTIHTKGGILKTKLTDDGVLLNGEAVEVYTGAVFL